VDTTSPPAASAPTPAPADASASPPEAAPVDPAVQACRAYLGLLLSNQLTPDGKAGAERALELLAQHAEAEATEAPSSAPAPQRPRRQSAVQWRGLRPGQNAQPFERPAEDPEPVDERPQRDRHRSGGRPGGVGAVLASLVPRSEERSKRRPERGRAAPPPDLSQSPALDWIATVIRRAPTDKRDLLERLITRLCDQARAGELTAAELVRLVQVQARLHCPEAPPPDSPTERPPPAWMAPPADAVDQMLRAGPEAFRKSVVSRRERETREHWERERKLNRRRKAAIDQLRRQAEERGDDDDGDRDDSD